ncbi:hypothetical protein LY78DRAFT_345190 [Colletotrichum sublineola]|nr:hypothetical protein LY78DRAFT_345190 [Colletotrichum sublineola]
MLVSFSALGHAGLRLLAILCDLGSTSSGVGYQCQPWAQAFISWVPSRCPSLVSFFLLSKSSRGSGPSHRWYCFWSFRGQRRWDWKHGHDWDRVYGNWCGLGFGVFFTGVWCLHLV